MTISTSFGQIPAMTGNPGFFLEDWKPKRFSGIGKTTEQPAIDKPHSVEVKVDFKDTITKVSPWIFGNNTGTWMGRDIMQGEDFVFKIKDAGITLLRYPGGNLANDFFWDAANEGQLPPGVPSSILKNKFSGRTTPPKLGEFGNFQYNPKSYYETLLRTGANGSICVNYSYVRYSTEEDSLQRLQNAVNYAAEWVREVNINRKLNVKFWEIGNENWGQWQAGHYVEGRGFIDPATYGAHCREFIKAMKAVDPTIKIGVVGYQKMKGSGPKKEIMAEWNEKVIPEIIDDADYYILHSYYTKHGTPATPEEMLDAVDQSAKYIKVVNKAITTHTDKPKNHLPIALTEFNTHSTATISKQDGAANVSHTAGVFFALNLGELVRQGYGSAMMWDLYNGYRDGDDHGMFTSHKETDMVKWSPHPSFYHYYFYNKCFGDILYNYTSTEENIRVYPTTFKSGEAGFVVVNKSPNSEVVSIKTDNIELGNEFYQYELYNEDPLSRQVFVNGVTSNQPAGGPANYRKTPANKISMGENGVKFESRPFSVNYIIVKSK